MHHLQDLGADPLCNIVAFAIGGADIVGLLTSGRSVRATLKGHVSRKHFQAMSIARWGEGCRCRYVVENTTNTAQNNSGSDVAGDTNDDGAGSVSSNNTGGDTGGEDHDSDDKSGSGEDADWLAFYLRRVRHRAVRPSPLDLLQEHYTEDAYRLFSCCILCSRTSGGDTVKDAVAAFFKACPTPTSVLSADQGELRKTLLPLGLNREVVIKRFAEGFLTSPWYDPSELHGCGRFASDSWQIFCLGSFRPGDKVAAAAAATTADESGSTKKNKQNRKTSGSGSSSRRGSLDRNLAAYCRFAERSSCLEREGGAAKGGRVGDSVDAPSGGGGSRKVAGEVAAAETSSTKRKRRRNAVSREPGKGTASSPAPKKRGRLDREQTAALGARGGRQDAPAGASEQARRRPLTVRGGGAGRAVGGVMSSREERALRRRG